MTPSQITKIIKVTWDASKYIRMTSIIDIGETINEDVDGIL